MADTDKLKKMQELIATTPLIVFMASWCGYCTKAINALKEAGYEFETVDMRTADCKDELREITGKTSVPQCFCKGQYIGGCNDGGLGGVLTCLQNGKLKEIMEGP